MSPKARVNHPGGEINLLCWLCPKKPCNAHLTTNCVKPNQWILCNFTQCPAIWGSSEHSPSTEWHTLGKELGLAKTIYWMQIPTCMVRFLPTPAYHFMWCARGLQLTPKCSFKFFCPIIANGTQPPGMTYKAQWYPRFGYLETSSPPAWKSQKIFASGVILNHS